MVMEGSVIFSLMGKYKKVDLKPPYRIITPPHSSSAAYAFKYIA